MQPRQRCLIPLLSSSPGENLLTMLVLMRHEPDSRTNAAAINSRAPQGRWRRQWREGMGEEDNMGGEANTGGQEVRQ